MAVDQARRDGAAMRLDHLVDRAAIGQRGATADGGDPAVLDQDGVGVEDRLRQVARQQKADAAQQGPALRGARRLFHRHAACPPPCRRTLAAGAA